MRVMGTPATVCMLTSTQLSGTTVYLEPFPNTASKREPPSALSSHKHTWRQESPFPAHTSLLPRPLFSWSPPPHAGRSKRSSLRSEAICFSMYDGVSSCDGVVETRVLIGPVPHISNVEGGQAGNDEGLMLSLCHPKLGTPTCYVLRNESLQEVHWFKQSYCSWFLGDFVCEDGGLYITTPVDPIFIFLPIFEEARMKRGNDHGMFRELDEILFVDGYPGYLDLLSVAEDSMRLVCEVKEIGPSEFFRLDDSKVLAWLCCKINNLKGTFSTLDKNYAAREEMDTLNDAVSLFSEYINNGWLKLLCNHLQLDIEDVTRKTPNKEILLTTDGESHPPLQHVKASNGKRNNDKQSKKQKVQVDSRNIKDMFMKASRGTLSSNG